MHAPVGATGQDSRGQTSPSGPRTGGEDAALQSQGAVIITLVCIHLFNVLLVSPFYRQED